MLIYCVTFRVPQEVVSGRGRVKKVDNRHTGFLVLCRNKIDAIRCLSWHFYNVYKKKIDNNWELDDVEVTLVRSKVDSRNFYFNYLLMDKMKAPLLMDDVSSNLLRINEIF